LTATNRSKFSSTNIRTASERDSIARSRLAIPRLRSLCVASGCCAERNTLASNALDERDVAVRVWMSRSFELGC
jgi:hypothetical protein